VFENTVPRKKNVNLNGIKEGKERTLHIERAS
jgi:hypothetical protein